MSKYLRDRDLGEFSKIRRVVALDVVRVLAFGAIVLWHIAEVYGLWWGKPVYVIPRLYTVSLGGLGVSLFIVLSGWVLELKYGKKKYDFWVFIRKRLARVYPVYWATLVFGIIIYLYKEWFLAAEQTYFAQITIREWLCSVSGTCSFLGWWGGPFLVTGWFIGVIVVLYFLFPWVSSAMHKSASMGLLKMFAISALAHLLIYRQWFGWGWAPEEWFPLARLFEFSLGVWLGVVVRKESLAKLNTVIPGASIWGYLGRLSFPFFLIHFQLRFLMVILEDLPTWLTITIYLIVCTVVSQGILAVVEFVMRLFNPKLQTLVKLGRI